MIKNFKQFVSSDVCLKCDGCCRFKDAQSPWRPKISADEESAARSSGVTSQVFGDVRVGGDRSLPANACGGDHTCVFFHTGDHTCGIYTQRPFECQLYPFIFSSENGALRLYVHLSCPFVQDHYGTDIYHTYVAYLQTRIKESDMQMYMRANASMFQDYSPFQDELQWISDLM